MSPPVCTCDPGFVVNVFKPPGWTSHDAVGRVRRILDFRKVGHTGTLDPFATGVLLCCVGRATKLSGYLLDLTQEYEGAMIFGRRTASGDVAGEVLEDRALPLPAIADLEATARGLEGESLQVPPMVSALRHQGRRLYQLARQGITVERAPRRVFVESFRILGAEGRQIRFRVRCARGTYVRTLVEDFGTRFGATACVEQLCRTRVGPFAAEDAVRLEGTQSAEEICRRAIPMSEALAHLPGWRLPSFWVRKLRDGQVPPWVVMELASPPRPGDVGRLLGVGGDLIAVGRAVAIAGRADRPWSDALGIELLRVI
jgi:tRNA pseudouridine55 synthase